MLLKDQVAIITGSAKGMGKGMAVKFAEEGCKVAIVDIDLKAAENTLAEIESKGGAGMALQCDVKNEKQVAATVKKVVEKYGKVDILINNAGGSGPSANIEDMSEEMWDGVFALNLKSQFFFCKYVVPLMKSRRYGKIINLSSIGALQPPVHHIAYNTAKAAALGFTRDLANALAPFNINVNALVPGPVRTEFYHEKTDVMSGDQKDTFFSGLGNKVPLRRAGTPEDMAGAALFLASSLGAYVTGQSLLATGGLPLLPPVIPAK
jgi:NAD(P)-dependent dehydrogenase (short-subunit alcohol dehydrogenase family)